MESGGGFYCSNSTLTMFGGKIHKNVAVKAGGAGECVKDCKFSMLGVDISSNTQKDPSNCKGIPNLLKKIKNQKISKWELKTIDFANVLLGFVTHFNFQFFERNFSKT